MNNLAYGQEIHTREIVLILPILPGKAEAWRRFVQEVQGSRRADHEASRRRMGIFAERTWISTTMQGEQAIIVIDAADPVYVLSELDSSEGSFDAWFRRQITSLHGLNLEQILSKILPDRVSTWQAAVIRNEINAVNQSSPKHILEDRS